MRRQKRRTIKAGKFTPRCGTRVVFEPGQRLGNLPYSIEEFLEEVSRRVSARLLNERRRGLRILLAVAKYVKDWRDLRALAAVTRDNRELGRGTADTAYKTVRELGRFLLARGETIEPLKTGDLRYARAEYFETEQRFRRWCKVHGYAPQRSVCQPFLRSWRRPVAEITYDDLKQCYLQTRSSSRQRQLSFRPFCRFLEAEGVIRVRSTNWERIASLPQAISAPTLRYIETIVAPRYSKSCTANTEVTLANFTRFMVRGGCESFSDLSAKVIEEYAAHLQARGLAAATANRRLSIVEMFCRQLLEWALLKRQPVRRQLYFNEGRTLPRALPAHVCEHVIRRLGERQRRAGRVAATAAVVSYECGLRLGELLRLERGNVDLERSTIRINQGKGRKDRVVPISRRAASSLQTWMETNPAQNGCRVLFQHDGHRYSAVAIEAELKAVAEELQVPVTMHVFRHSFATRFLERGGRVEVLQKILGHENINTTMRYVLVSAERIKQSYLAVMDDGQEDDSIPGQGPRPILELLEEGEGEDDEGL